MILMMTYELSGQNIN